MTQDSRLARRITELAEVLLLASPEVVGNDMWISRERVGVDLATVVSCCYSSILY